MALIGTLLVVGAPSAAVSPDGIAFSFGASIVGAALYLLLERKLHEPSPLLIVAIGTSVATVIAIAIKPDGLSEELTNGSDRALLVIGAGAGGAAAVLLALVGIRHSSAFVAGIAVTCGPVFAGLLAWFVLGETLPPLQLLGGAIVLIGLAFAFAEMPQSSSPLPETGERLPVGEFNRRQ